MATKKTKTIRQITWKEAVDLSLKYYKPVLDKLREYDLKKEHKTK